MYKLVLYLLGGRETIAASLTRFDVPLLWSSLIYYPSSLWQGSSLLVGKALGGSGVLNAMIYMRGLRSDFEGWNLPSWNWKKIFSIYTSLETFIPEKAEETIPSFHGTSGPMHTSRPDYVDQISPEFVSAAVHAGLPLIQDFNDPGQRRYGVGYFHFNIHHGLRDSAAHAFLSPILSSPSSSSSSSSSSPSRRFDLLLNTTVTRVLVAPSPLLSPTAPKKTPAELKAIGVEYIDSNGETRTAYLRKHVEVETSLPLRFPTGCVILSAGALMTPKLLLFSGIGPPEVLRSLGVEVKVPSPQVGRNIQDHPSVGLTFALVPSATAHFPSLYEAPLAMIRYASAVEYHRAIKNHTLLAYNERLQAGLSSGSSMKTEEGEVGVLGSVGLSAGAFLRSPFADANSSAPDIQVRKTLSPKTTILSSTS